MRYEDVLKNKGIIIYEVKHIKTDKVNQYILLEFESHELNENNKLFNFLSSKLLKKK